MSGLIALLDDIAALVKLTAASVDDIAAGAARASVKAAGVVVDDAAVTPQYVHGIDPRRELPIIRKIAVGSLRNKLLFILPVALVLSEFMPWLLTPILMIGGTYLCFEGAEKIWAKLTGHHAESDLPVVEQSEEAEKKLVRGAITTDFILSAEIMVIALNEVADQTLLVRTGILIVVGIGITLLVYGVVGLIVKMDDIGLALTKRKGTGVQRVGALLVEGMPKLLTFLSVVGTFAMIWVGGHILLVGTGEIGIPLIYDWVHGLETAAAAATGALGGFIGWLVNTFISLILGFIWGSLVVWVVHLFAKRKKNRSATNDESALTESS
ncbi:DUF808 domain-containing protein [Micrococcoides hystricis]|uniref:DUF808 domain-containing protein n=1 Tax=Micrococcoides hystricis TaxID=1572761 RepID=A0ABV6P9V7_9MICC